MSDKIIFDDNDWCVYLGRFPKRIKIATSSLRKNYVTYTPLISAKTIITMDDDTSIGNSSCSNCNNSIDIFDKYCKHCGAKMKRETREKVE